MSILSFFKRARPEPKYKNLTMYYNIRGDGVAELDIDKVLLSEEFNSAMDRLMDVDLATRERALSNELHCDSNR